MTDTTTMRANICEYEITRIGELLEHLPKNTSFTQSWYYRGQKQDWPLVPRLFRYNRIPQHIDTWEKLEESMLAKFKVQAAPLLAIQPRHDLEWLALAQHHGLATRLLDWTENPLAALFFAVEDSSAYADEITCDGVLWALKMSRVQFFDPVPGALKMSVINRYLKKIELYAPTQVSQRITAQKGYFTLHPLPEGSKDFIPLDHRCGDFLKFIVPTDVKKGLLYELNNMGIDFFTLFPDLGGLSQKINWEIERDTEADFLNESRQWLV